MAEMELKIPKSSVIVLSGDKISAYVEIVTLLLKAGKLNKFYPDQSAVANLFSFFIPEKNYGLYETLEINYDTGLPTEKEITRVIVDRDIALKSIKEDSEEDLRKRAGENPSEVNVRRLNRYLYHKALLEDPIPPLMSVKLQLRSVDTEKYIAFFNVDITRFDVSTSMFVKYTLVVGQEDVRWTETQQVQLVGDDLKYTLSFRNLLSKYTVNESEFAFVLLNDLEKVTIEEVQRCRIGPLYFRGVNIPHGMDEIFKKHPDAFILSFPGDRASMLLNWDKNNDPLVSMYRDTLDPQSRDLRDKKAEQIGYHVFKERKFSCTRKALRDFQDFLRKRNARCVVYGV